MPGKYKTYSPEFRNEAARLVVESSRPIADVARELGISETSLGNWVRAYSEKHKEDEPPLELHHGLAAFGYERKTEASLLSRAADLDHDLAERYPDEPLTSEFRNGTLTHAQTYDGEPDRAASEGG